MHKGFVAAAVISGAAGVALGAFGAHGLKKLAGDGQLELVTAFQTGVQYQMYHTLALLIVALAYNKISENLLRRAALCFIAGIVLFSGSLYLLTVLKLNAMPAKWLGPVTPVGGVFFILGWVFLAIAVTRNKY